MRNSALFVSVICFFLFAAPASTGDEDAAYKLVRVSAHTLQESHTLRTLCLDVIDAREDGIVVLVARDQDLRALADAGLSYTIEIADLESYYGQRLQADPALGNRAWPEGSMGGYFTNSEVEAELDAWAALYPNLITPKMSIGTSVEGRTIWAVKISDNPTVDESEPETFYDSLTHAREVMGMTTVLYYMKNLLEQYGTDPELTYLVDNREIWFVPVHNPDGHVYNEQTNPSGGGMWRKNRRHNGGGIYGVDLGRNYDFMWGYDTIGSSTNPNSLAYRGPYAFSEPEALAVSDFIASRPIVSSWNTHTYTNVYICPFAYDDFLPYGNDWPLYKEYLKDITAENGYPIGPSPDTLGYYANGCPLDWHYGDQGIFCLAPEIGSFDDGFWPPKSRIVPLAEESQLACRYWSWIAGSFVRLDDQYLFDDNGDGIFLPGEPIDLTVSLRNKGLGGTASAVTATLSASSPYVTLIDDFHDFGSIASVSNALNVSDPFEFKFKNTTPYGTAVTLELNISFDGYTMVEPVTLTCGVPELLYRADMEADPGWTVGDTGDNATTGIWERDDPIGIMDGTQDVQPEDDHTGSSGTQCFITGNNSYTADGDDVDHGKTTLKTALFDVAGAPNATIHYWRWYTDLGPVHNNDPFEVDISNDGGTSWINVETLDHMANSWNEAVFKIGDIIAPTNQMMMRFVARDEPDDSYCEACIDDFTVLTYDPPVVVALSGPAAIGTSVNVLIDAPAGGGLEYFLAASLDTYPAIPVDGATRFVPLKNDWLTQMSMNPTNPIFKSFYGYLDSSGQSASPRINVPNNPNLVGMTLFVAALTLNPIGAPPRVNNISAPLPITIE